MSTGGFGQAAWSPCSLQVHVQNVPSQLHRKVRRLFAQKSPVSAVAAVLAVFAKAAKVVSVPPSTGRGTQQQLRIFVRFI